MSLYNMLFGKNSQSALLLAVIGLREHDVDRFRDVSVSTDGRQIEVYTRTGGNNRADYPNLALRKAAGWEGSTDDDFDNTYCTDTFRVDEQWVADVAGLSDILSNGIRAEFAKHLAKTLNREPTEEDKAAAEYAAEDAALGRVPHMKANGHTFVPMSDAAMECALKIAEANGGQLRTCWSILPLAIEVKRDHHPWPSAKDKEVSASMVRAEIDVRYPWAIDFAYWNHCLERWSGKFPLSIAKITEAVERYGKAA